MSVRPPLTLRGVPVDDCIEPTTATRAAGGHAELVALRRSHSPDSSSSSVGNGLRPRR